MVCTWSAGKLNVKAWTPLMMLSHIYGHEYSAGDHILIDTTWGLQLAKARFGGFHQWMYTRAPQETSRNCWTSDPWSVVLHLRLTMRLRTSTRVPKEFNLEPRSWTMTSRNIYLASYFLRFKVKYGGDKNRTTLKNIISRSLECVLFWDEESYAYLRHFTATVCMLLWKVLMLCLRTQIVKLLLLGAKTPKWQENGHWLKVHWNYRPL